MTQNFRRDEMLTGNYWKTNVSNSKFLSQFKLLNYFFKAISLFYLNTRILIPGNRSNTGRQRIIFDVLDENRNYFMYRRIISQYYDTN